MNKKLSHFFLVAILAIATLIPMFPQPVVAQQQVPDPAPRKVILINQFNRRALNFNQIALRASGTVGNARMLFLLSAALGVPVTVLESEFFNFNVPIEQFVLSRIISVQVGVPVHLIIGQVEIGRSFGQIALQFNVNFRLAFLRMAGFSEALLNEIGLSQGVIVADPAEVQAKLALAMGNLGERFDMLQAIIGERLFTELVLRRLANETGTDFNTLLVLRGDRLGNLALSEFVTFILADNSLSAAVRVGLEFNGNVLVTPGGIYGRFDESEIPAQLLLNRILIFTRAVNTDANNG